MSPTRYFALCALVLLGAFAGGYVANRATPVAHAQTLPGPENIRTTGVTLVDSQGKVMATMRGGPKGAEVILNDAAGMNRLDLSAAGGVVVRDEVGRITWQSRPGIFPAQQ
jgi:hypothetical protein